MSDYYSQREEKEEWKDTLSNDVISSWVHCQGAHCQHVLSCHSYLPGLTVYTI